MSLLLDGIRDPIDRLYKLSTWIRNLSSRFASSKALCHQQFDPDTNVDFLKAVEHFDYDYVDSIFLQYRKSKAREENLEYKPPYKDNHTDDVWEPVRTVLSDYKREIPNDTDTFLVHRLARANVWRRQYFAYWKKHREKLAQHSKAAAQHVHIRKEAGPIQVNLQIRDSGLSVLAMALGQSVTTASRLNVPHQFTLRDDQSSVSVSEYAPSCWQPSKEYIKFPPPPKLRPSEKFSECPFCFMLCPRALLAEKAWQ